MQSSLCRREDISLCVRRIIKVFVVVVALPKGQQVGMYQDRTVHMRESIAR